MGLWVCLMDFSGIIFLDKRETCNEKKQTENNNIALANSLLSVLEIMPGAEAAICDSEESSVTTKATP